MAGELFDSKELTPVETGVMVQSLREWTAQRQVLARRKRNVDAELEKAVEKTEALKTLVGDEFAVSGAKERVRRLRMNLNAELEGWRAVEPMEGYSPRVDAYLLDRMMNDEYGRPDAELLERHAEKLVDVVSAGYEGSMMYVALVVEHDGDPASFVRMYASDMALTRVGLVPF